ASLLEVFARPQVRQVLWNDKFVQAGRLPGPQPVAFPALTGWRYLRDVPEADPAFDEGDWTAADHVTTNNPTRPTTLPVLYTDDYGFHYGDVWYRGHFTGAATGIALT